MSKKKLVKYELTLHNIRVHAWSRNYISIFSYLYYLLPISPETIFYEKSTAKNKTFLLKRNKLPLYIQMTLERF